MSTIDTRSTRIAVFIDFDNVEIGVKSTIGTQFDIGLVLEAIKERGEIVTKIAYSDWKRAGDYSRLLTLHAIRMVQRNVTPGGDKNGADITMALDALEMAFTHAHINAFVIVGGDSDFISLVEKLKQYGRTVIVVGGRQFTSVTMQKNCHEFIAYENLLGNRGGGGRSQDRGKPVTTSEIAKALPLVKRALKVLSEREVTPQLGLLKSTLLQLDSTFSERNYGASSFRDFMEKVAAVGVVVLRQSGRSMLVEATEDFLGGETVESPVAAPVVQEAQPIVNAPADEDEDEEALPVSPMTMQDGIRAVQQALGNAARWPMYVRQAKQFLKNNIEGFDERKYGFASVVDLLRAAGKEGVLRIERDRQGAIRVFPGEQMAKPSPVVVEESDTDAVIDADPQPATDSLDTEIVFDAPIVDIVAADVISILDVQPDLDADVEEDVDDVNGNIAGVATHEMTTVAARKRRSPSRPKPSGRPASSPRVTAEPRRGAKKAPRRQKVVAK